MYINRSLDNLKAEARQKGVTPERLLELARMGPELAREVAKSKNTPPEVLAELIEQEDFLTRILAVGSKNISTKTLHLLLKDISKHRILSWFWKDLPQEIALRFLQDSESDVRHNILARQWRTHPIRKRRGDSPYTLPQPLPLEAILPLLHDEYEPNQELAAMIAGRMDSLHFPDMTALKREARKKGTPPKRLLELAALRPELAREMLRSMNTPPEVLGELAIMYPENEKILGGVAIHPNTPVHTLEDLAEKVPWSVASNRNAPASLLRQLAKHPNSSVYESVIQNPSAPESVMRQLVKEREGRPSSLDPSEILELYSKGTKYFDDFLLRNIERSDFIPAEAALALARHPNPEIRQALLQHIDKVAQAVRPQILAQLQGESS